MILCFSLNHLIRNEEHLNLSINPPVSKIAKNHLDQFLLERLTILAREKNKFLSQGLLNLTGMLSTLNIIHWFRLAISGFLKSASRRPNADRLL